MSTNNRVFADIWLLTVSWNLICKIFIASCTDSIYDLENERWLFGDMIDHVGWSRVDKDLSASNVQRRSCIYLLRPSPLSVPHSTWLRTYTDSDACRQSLTMDRETVTIISWWDHRSSASLDSAIGTGFYKLLLVFAISYTLCMPKFYMPTLINHRNNSKTAPISLYFVRPSGWCSLLQRYF